jgi:hypothetical protein
MRTAMLSAADDWRQDPASWVAGTDPLRILVTLQDHGEVPDGVGLPVYLVVARYVDGQIDRATLEGELRTLIPDEVMRG